MLISSLLAVLFLAYTTISLQVSSNSPCTSVCTSSSSSSTLGSEIACLDADYAGTPTGQKFMSCVSCLQTSTASDENGSDQEWFLYNLRFALDTCLFGFQQPSDAVTAPCSMSDSCQPLQLALGDGNLVPSNETEYSYCSTDSNAILGSSLGPCKDCLSNTSDEKYLRNFLTALQAGCVQQPPTGTLIGLEGSVFSTTPVNITSPGSNQSATSSSKATHKSGLPQGAVIGIAVGLAVLLLVTIAILIVCAQRRKSLNRLAKKSLHSPLHSRFGATNITAPTNGAYGNPYAPPTAVNEPFHAPSYTAKELNVLDNALTVLEKHHSSPRELKDPSGGWRDLAHTRLANALTNQTGTALPTHQAYIPDTFSSVSPPPQTPVSETASDITSDATSDTYQMKDYPSSRSSPKNIPPPLILEPKLPLHKRAPSKTSPPYIPQVQAIYPPSQSSPPKSEFRSQSQAQLRYERNRSLSRPRNGSRTRNDSRHRDDSRTRAESRAEGRSESRTRGESRAESRTRADSRAQSRTREESRSRGMEESSRLSPPLLHSQRMEESSRVSPPLLHSQRMEESSRVSPPLLHSQRLAGLEEVPSRSASRSDTYKRNTARPGIANTNASKDRPIISHGGRFDFELAERERIEKERMDGFASITKDSFKKKKHRPEDATPITAESGEEQWPGSY